MGRGRSKAKATKIARELKYTAAGDGDLARLQAELRAAREAGDTTSPTVQVEDDPDGQ